MTARSTTRFAVTGALLAATTLVLGVPSASAQQNSDAGRVAARAAPAEVVGTEATRALRVPWMKQVQSDCSENSVACTLDFARVPARVRIEVRNTYCIIQVSGDSQMQSVNLTRASPILTEAFLLPTRTAVDRFGNSTFVATQESFFFANPGDRLLIRVVATDADIRFAVCTLAGERVILR